jgi:hypothetical protein
MERAKAARGVNSDQLSAYLLSTVAHFCPGSKLGRGHYFGQEGARSRDDKHAQHRCLLLYTGPELIIS